MQFTIPVEIFDDWFHCRYTAFASNHQIDVKLINLKSLAEVSKHLLIGPVYSIGSLTLT